MPEISDGPLVLVFQSSELIFGLDPIETYEPNPDGVPQPQCKSTHVN